MTKLFLNAIRDGFYTSMWWKGALFIYIHSNVVKVHIPRIVIISPDLDTRTVYFESCALDHLCFVFVVEKYHAQMKEAQQVVAEKTSALEAEAYKTKRLHVSMSYFKNQQ